MVAVARVRTRERPQPGVNWSTFAGAVDQADTYGVPVADVLRVQADEARMKRRQRAEEQAMKVPVEVVLPLVGCILPALPIVVVGPAATRIVGAPG